MIADRAVWRVGKNAFARLAAQVWARLLSLALVALVARYEGPASLGRYVLVLTVVGIVGALADLGLNIFLTREAARSLAPGRGSTSDIEGHKVGQAAGLDLLGVVLPLKATLALVGYTGLVVASGLMPFLTGTRPLLLLGGLSLLPEALTGAMGALINARQRMEVTGLLNMLTRLAALAGALPALILGYGVAGVLICTLGANLLNVLMHGVALRRWGLSPRLRWGVAPWRACLAESYPFAVTAIIAMIYARLDLVLLSAWQGDIVAGWYAAAYKLWEAVGLIPASILDAMFPEMSRLAGDRRAEGRLGLLFRKGGRAMLAGGLALSAAGMAGASPLIGLVYGSGENYEPAIPAFRILVWAIPAMFLYLLSGHALYATGRQRLVTKMMLLVGVFNVGLNLIVIPRWSYLGAAGVALVSELLLLGLLYPAASRALGAGKADESHERETFALP